MKSEKAFKNTHHNGIHLWFPNGNGISTIWGFGSHTENNGFDDRSFPSDLTQKFNTFMESNDCEIMILNCPSKLLKKIQKKYNEGSDECVINYLDIKKWLEIINLLAK